MEKLKKILFGFSILVLIGVGYVSCDDDDNNDNNGGTTHMKVSLTDHPGDYDAVKIEVVDVRIKRSDNTDDNGWESVGNVHPGIYDLLTLTGGVTQLLAESDLPAGYIGQIRLILGDENTVTVDGVVHDLDTPSAQQSGLKLQLKQTLLPDVEYHYLLDFDVDKSIVSAGNSGKYILKPVIQISSVAVSGSIKGTITPMGLHVTASVNVNGTIVTANTDAAGVFVLHGIPAGTYTVTLTPDTASGFTIKTIENVVVINAQTTDTGTTAFP